MDKCADDGRNQQNAGRYFLDGAQQLHGGVLSPPLQSKPDLRGGTGPVKHTGDSNRRWFWSVAILPGYAT